MGTSAFTALEAFRDAMRENGLMTTEQLRADGKIHRFHVEGDRRESRNGWYVFYDGDIAYGAYGTWKDPDNWHSWCSRELSSLTRMERAALNVRHNSADAARRSEAEKIRCNAQNSAMQIWKAAMPCSEHAYLTRKQVPSYGLRTHFDGRLIVPLFNVEGTMQTVQFISEAREDNKRFLRGGVKSSHFFVIGQVNHDTKRIWVVEGYATGGSLHKATKEPVVVAFDSLNLPKVTEALRKKFPNPEIIIGGDDDQHRKENPGRKAALEAASLCDGKAIFPRFLSLEGNPTDFNDLHCREGLDVVCAQIEKAFVGVSEVVATSEQHNKTEAVASVDDEWEAPLELEYRLPAWPSEVFPTAIDDLIKAVVDAVEVPIELPAMMALSSLATCSQGSYVVRVHDDYCEPLQLWTCAALPSGNRKSKVFELFTAPLMDWERDVTLQMREEVARSEYRIEDIEGELQHHQKKAREGDSEAKEQVETLRTSLREAEENRIVTPQLWSDDVTPEKVGELLARNKGRIAILSDEGGIFEQMGGRYNKGIPNLDTYLKGHAGSPIRIERRNSSPVFVQNPSLTIGICPQPEVLRLAASKEGFRGKGLLARFLYVLPKSHIGYRKLESVNIRDWTRAAYNSVITAILQHSGKARSDSTTQEIRLSPDAHAVYKNYAQYIEAFMRPGEKLSHLTDWGGKLPGAMLRIAGQLHVARHPEKPDSHLLSLTDALSSTSICEVLLEHALAVFDFMGRDTNFDNARNIQAWIRRKQLAAFSVRDCHYDLKHHFKGVIEVEAALKILEQHHIIRRQLASGREGASPKGGRPSSPIIEVNPAVHVK